MLALFIVYVSSLSACIGPPARGGTFDDCFIGQDCVIDGKLSLYAGQPPAWVALLEVGGQCGKLALPDSFFEDEKQRQYWNGVRITVTGRTFLQPRFDESEGVATLWYTEGGRKLALGMCDGGIGIYVDSMRSRQGRVWSSDLSTPVE